MVLHSISSDLWRLRCIQVPGKLSLEFVFQTALLRIGGTGTGDLEHPLNIPKIGRLTFFFPNICQFWEYLGIFWNIWEYLGIIGISQIIPGCVFFSGNAQMFPVPYEHSSVFRHLLCQISGVLKLSLKHLCQPLPNQKKDMFKRQ